ncbi:hypothetical protein D0N36_18710 [Hymenobacter lapidiphilus]|uniref:hypothetical protein n=1 Tax=Hymenobacter sp. CCM 8763 TaxID=2303334 RepID=UPI000E353B48|nr:hypothetical protein [Hymenobacter sp. CCM 8763]RFP63558.1 hypothetical protein D0N36_18710 [Hymenobacter sp. CCM 8763]
MAYDTRFGPSAQTPEQRAAVLELMLTFLPRLKTKAPPAAQQFYDRYVAGELSWEQMRQALNAA